MRQNPRRKASYSQSPTANPETPIHRLAAGFQRHLYFPDPTPLYTLMGSVVANLTKGPPIWLMMIGPPSCGKTVLLDSLTALPRFFSAGMISSPGALLSGSKKKDRTSGSTGGLLRQCEPHGSLVFKDFSASILSLRPESLKEVISAFRECYDGHWTRDIGSDGARQEHWNGKLAIFAGSTAVIDSHQQVMSEMGERFLYYRYPDSDGWGEAYQALSSEEPPEEIRTALSGIVEEFVSELGISWENPSIAPELTIADRQRIVAMSQFAARGRAAIKRDSWTKEILETPTIEYPTRVSKQLRGLLQAMRLIGVGEPDVWKIVSKLVFDMIPSMRRAALVHVMRGEGDAGEIARRMKVHKNTVRRCLEDLEALEMVSGAIDGSKWFSPGEWLDKKLKEAKGLDKMNESELVILD